MPDFQLFCKQTLKKTLSILLLLGIPAVLQGQTPDFTGDTATIQKCWPLRMLDTILDFRDNLTKSDTMYISSLPQKIKLGFAVNCSGAEIDAKGVGEHGDFRTMLSAEMKTTVSVNVAYRGLGIGLKLNPANIFGKKSSTEFDISFYGNSVGIDAVYQSTGVFKGHISNDGNKVYVPAGVVNMDMLLVNTYYAFNAKKFSYPAAFDHSCIQRRGSGSILAGVSYSLGKLSAKENGQIGNASMTLNTSFASIGVGYGYNFVIKNDWLLHLSAIPQVVLYSHNRLRVSTESEKAPYRFPDMMVIGRLSLVRHFPKYYFGISGKVTTSTIGDRSRLLLNNVKWIGQMTFGIKLK